MITPKMIKPLDHKKDRRRIEQYLVVGCLNRMRDRDVSRFERPSVWRTSSLWCWCTVLKWWRNRYFCCRCNIHFQVLHLALPNMQVLHQQNFLRVHLLALFTIQTVDLNCPILLDQHMHHPQWAGFTLPFILLISTSII